ncbi:hypothetical protein FYJ26_00805 [Anaerococcus sp. WCA-380-WT-2B]|uniref:Uncharacterized protein n=1 Tax=Anaerococcus porci TaxID=2652269 RepID=A0A6N7VT42_9FIRM|nr:hypothetical protein [Anaerococcus porci]MSS76987.1 hypothetical protein [Anaerococcus porci]
MSKPFHFNILGNKTGSEWASYQYEKNHLDIISVENVEENNEFKIKITLGNIHQKGQLELVKIGKLLTGTTTEDKLVIK